MGTLKENKINRKRDFSLGATTNEKKMTFNVFQPLNSPENDFFSLKLHPTLQLNQGGFSSDKICNPMFTNN